jgi:small GTP-binding protein
MSDEDNENGNKVIFLGESNVGKTNLMRISVGKSFDSHSLSTWSVSYLPKVFTYNKKTFVFNLWDTIGQETYRSLTRIFFKNAIIVLLVYDITSRKTFEELEYWYQQVKNELDNEFLVAIIGNKKDLFTEMKVTEEEGKKYAEEKGAKFKLSSAKDDPMDFNQFLEDLLKESIEKNLSTINRSRGLSIRSKVPEEKKKCC